MTLNPECGWVGWKMPAAPSWDSFSLGAKEENQGGLERAPGNVGSAETGQ